jgi:hypothetical protein
MSAKRKRELVALLKEVYDEQYAHTGLDHPPLDDPRYQVKQWAGVCGDEYGRRCLFLFTGDAKWFLCYWLLPGGGVICTGGGFPVKKVDLPKDLRRALAAGWVNSRILGLAKVLERAESTAWHSSQERNAKEVGVHSHASRHKCRSLLCRCRHRARRRNENVDGWRQQDTASDARCNGQSAATLLEW